MDEKYLINKSTLVGIADAIRTQKGTSDPIDVIDYESEILSIGIVKKPLEVGMNLKGKTIVFDTSRPFMVDNSAEIIMTNNYYFHTNAVGEVQPAILYLDLFDFETLQVTDEEGVFLMESYTFNSRQDAIIEEILDGGEGCEWSNYISVIEKGIVPTGTLEITENGEHNVYNYAKVNVSVIGGDGGSITDRSGYRVRYIDADGTILKEEYVQKGGTTTPPSNPSYDSEYLEFQEWNYDTTNLVVENDLDIGATYKTKDDCTYLFCRFTTKTGLNPTLQITGTVTIDWGDGTIDNLSTHTYAEAGEYTIKISGITGISTSTGNTYLMGSSNLNKTIRKCYVGNASILTNYAFYTCANLRIITIPKGIKQSYSHIFYNCYNLKSIVIPNGVTTIVMYAFYACSTLKIFSIPKSANDNGQNSFQACNFLEFYNLNGDKYIENSQFYGCMSLKSITMSSNLYSIGHESFYNCYSLKSIVIPSGVKTIGKSAFYNCRTLENLVFKCTSVPTLTNINAFGNINISATMWVNDDIIEDLKAATNWSNYADYMQPLSSMPQDLREELGV